MSMSRAPVVCRSPNMVLKRYRGTVTWDVWSSLGGTLMGLGGLGKSMMSPATLFTMDCRGRRRHGRVRAAHPRGFDPASPTQPPPVSNPAPPSPRPSSGQGLPTHVDVQLYVLVRDERQCGQSEFHRPKRPQGHQACVGRGGRRKTL